MEQHFKHYLIGFLVGLGIGYMIFYGKIPNGLSHDFKESDFDKDDLDDGEEVELEHTSSHRLARQIAMDHLSEDPDYYRKLAKMEQA